MKSSKRTFIQYTDEDQIIIFSSIKKSETNMCNCLFHSNMLLAVTHKDPAEEEYNDLVRMCTSDVRSTLDAIKDKGNIIFYFETNNEDANIRKSKEIWKKARSAVTLG